MADFNNLAETYRETAREDGSMTASAALFDASYEERANPNRAESVAAALDALTSQGVIPLVSFEYLNSKDSSSGISNFEDIADDEEDDSQISESELEIHLAKLEAQGASFSPHLVREILDKFDEVAGNDGLMSEAEYKDYIAQQQTALFEPLTVTVQPGDGFDLIAQRVYREILGVEPSAADVIALSERIAEIQETDRNYAGGYLLHPDQELTLMSLAELQEFADERQQ